MQLGRQDRTIGRSLSNILIQSFCLLESHWRHTSAWDCGPKKGLQRTSKFQRHKTGTLLYIQSQLNETNI